MDRLKTELPPVQPSWAERLLVGIAVVGLFAMAALVTTNVISRWIGRALIPDDVLLVQELMVLAILLPIGAVTALRQHITVDLFTENASPVAKRSLALLGHVVGLCLGGFLMAAAWQGFAQAWSTQDYYNGVLNIPMWVGQAAFLFGIGLFLLRLAAMIAVDCRGFRR